MHSVSTRGFISSTTYDTLSSCPVFNRLESSLYVLTLISKPTPALSPEHNHVLNIIILLRSYQSMLDIRSAIAVPPGQFAPFSVVTETDHAAWIIITGSLGLSWTLLFSGIRIFIRPSINRALEYDEYAIAGSTVSCLRRKSSHFTPESRAPPPYCYRT